jgi:GNAT superfamily N-acetyltransferase
MNSLRGLPGRPAYPFVEQRYQLQLEMVRPSAAGLLKVRPVPEGYVLRQLRKGDERAYDDLFHLAFADLGRFQETLDEALDLGFFVVEHAATGRLVASCVAMRGSYSVRHPGAGQLGWLVTDPSHARKGLGGIVSAAVTNRLIQEGYKQPFLGTEDFRFAAISIYLKQGWKPNIYHAEMECRWREIYAELGMEFTSNHSELRL